MSIYKPKGSPFYQYDFQLDGVRFSGSTRTASRREAEKIEAARRQEARREIDAAGADRPMTIGMATTRYWTEVGKHHAGAETTLTNLNRLVGFFGNDMPLASIGDNEVAQLVAWRRAQSVKGLGKRPVSASTVNRSTIEPLQKLFNRAVNTWKIPLPDAPKWRQHLLAEPQERVREVSEAEEAALEAVREDYRPLIDFARASGLRMSECLFPKTAVDLKAGIISVTGKGGKPIRHPITDEMRMILMAEMANDTAQVFTYVARRGRNKGRRAPITVSGLKTLWRRSKGAGLPADLRFHDLRHDFATKLLRVTGNLKLVQIALHHSKVETTTRYAHVLDEEVRAGMEAAAKRRAKSRKKSRTKAGVVA